MTTVNMSWALAGHLVMEGRPGPPVGIPGISLVLSEHFPFFAHNSSGSQSSIKLQFLMFNCRKTQMTVL